MRRFHAVNLAFMLGLILGISVMVFVADTTPARAQVPPPPTYMAQQFQFDCQQDGGPERDRCINYLGGILDLQRHIKNAGLDGSLFCPPFFLTADKARQDYLAWGEKNPYYIVGPPIISIVQAFQQVYAC
ncbi:MAG: Rap1a/Tai family immunity protein [Pseudomonadota bacterium]